jgi:membrane-associated phospholipid phosphatase
MSGWDLIINNIGRMVTPECVVYEDNFFGAMLVLANLFPIILPLVIVIVSWTMQELLLTIIGLIMSTNYWLNYGLQYAIRQPPPTVGCGNTYEMPSLATQYAVMIALIYVYCVNAWKLYASEMRIILSVVAVTVFTYARIYIGFNTPAQLYVGAMIGAAYGTAWFLVILFVIAPRMDRIIHWPLVRRWYLRNEICQPRSFDAVPLTV